MKKLWAPKFSIGDFIICNSLDGRKVFIIGISTSSKFYFCLSYNSIVIISHKDEDNCKKIEDDYDIIEELII